MSARLLNSLHLQGFLSFAPDSEPTALTNLNVLIGPNGVGKSNLIEAIELLHATPSDFREAIRVGGAPSDWIWRGPRAATRARLTAIVAETGPVPRPLRYSIEFADSGGRVDITDEVLEETTKASPEFDDVFFYYRFQDGRPVINVHERGSSESVGAGYSRRALRRESIDPQQSILSLRREPDLYPEITHVASRFGAIRLYREWSFGRSAALRAPQRADLSKDAVLPNLVNLGLMLNEIEHSTDRWDRFTKLMQMFLPRFSRLTTRVLPGGSVQINLHEDGIHGPIPATRLSDGTLRFLALLAILLSADSASLICVEEPELGLHPDSIAILAELLIEASRATQLVVTTHSDVLVSELTEYADSVLVCDFAAGGTKLQRIDAGKLKHWLSQYRLGEIWQAGKLGGNLF